MAWSELDIYCMGFATWNCTVRAQKTCEKRQRTGCYTEYFIYYWNGCFCVFLLDIFRADNISIAFIIIKRMIF